MKKQNLIVPVLPSALLITDGYKMSHHQTYDDYYLSQIKVLPRKQKKQLKKTYANFKQLQYTFTPRS